MDQKPLPEYTLTGVMHYLQQESTRNERDRVQWASEREEMKLAITRLTSENKALKSTNQRLELELTQLRGTKSNNNMHSASSDIDDLASLKVETLNIEPLKQAREHLKSRMSEVVRLLKSSDLDMVDMLELKKQRGVLAFAERKKKREMEQAMEGSMVMNNIPSPESEPGSPSDFLEKGVTPDMPMDEQDFEANEYAEEETDNETVMGDDEDDRLHPTEKPQHFLDSTPLVTLSAHPSTITALAVRHDKLLSASKEGEISCWKLAQLVADHESVKPSKSFYDAETPLFLQWISPTSFVSASKKTVRLWEESRAHSPKFSFTPEGEIKDIQHVEGHLVIHTTSGLHIYTPKHGNVIDRSSVKKVESTSECTSFTLTKTRIYVYIGNAIEEIDINTGMNICTLVTIPELTSPVTKLFIKDTTIALTSQDKCLLFELHTGGRWIIDSKGRDFTNCELTETNYIVFCANGDVEIYNRSNDHLVKKWNHYLQSNFSAALGDLVPITIGTLYQQQYVITGGEDMQVRVWEV